ncbi:MAG: DsrE family protein [Nitrososphaerota archaeon]|nr:DsrE family protein [Nitrososphaerota archaeon]
MKSGIVLGSNELSKLLFAGMEAVTRTSLGDQVSVFLTMDAVRAFTKVPETGDSTAASGAAKKEGRTYRDMFQMAKKTGRAKLYACSYASDLFSLGREDYGDLVDDILGMTSFFAEVDGQISSVW